MARYKLTRDKKSNYSNIDYFRVEDPQFFRYNLIKGILKGDNLIFSIDTKLMQSSADSENFCKKLEDYFERRNILFFIRRAAKKEKKLLGIRVGEQKEKEFLVYFLINEEDLDQEFYHMFLSTSDYLIGVNPVKVFEKIMRDIDAYGTEVFFHKENFEYTFYDSALIKRARTSKTVPEPLNMICKKQY